MKKIKFVKTSPDAITPKYAYHGDGGLDIATITEKELKPRSKPEKFHTGIKIQIPYGYGGFLIPRSGLASKGIMLPSSPALIDAGYRGEFFIYLVNYGKEKVLIKKGQRIAQLAIIKLPEMIPVEVEELDTSDRGLSGFGSSG